MVQPKDILQVYYDTLKDKYFGYCEALQDYSSFETEDLFKKLKMHLDEDNAQQNGFQYIAQSLYRTLRMDPEVSCQAILRPFTFDTFNGKTKGNLITYAIYRGQNRFLELFVPLLEQEQKDMLLMVYGTGDHFFGFSLNQAYPLSQQLISMGANPHACIRVNLPDMNDPAKTKMVENTPMMYYLMRHKNSRPAETGVPFPDFYGKEYQKRHPLVNSQVLAAKKQENRRYYEKAPLDLKNLDGETLFSLLVATRKYKTALQLIPYMKRSGHFEAAFNYGKVKLHLEHQRKEFERKLDRTWGTNEKINKSYQDFKIFEKEIIYNRLQSTAIMKRFNRFNKYSLRATLKRMAFQTTEVVEMPTQALLNFGAATIAATTLAASMMDAPEDKKDSAHTTITQIAHQKTFSETKGIPYQPALPGFERGDKN